MAQSNATTRGSNFSVGRAVSAGLIAGLVFVVMEMALVSTVGGGSPWGPPRMMAAIVLGQPVLPGPENPPTFDAGVFLAGMVVHFALSIALAMILAVLLTITGVGAGAAMAIGAVFGIVVYVVNFYGFTEVFPWVAMARNWITIVSHIVFGVVLSAVYRGRSA